MAAPRLSLARLIRLNAIAFGLTMVTGTVEPALLGHRLFALVQEPSQRALWFGLITFSGLAVATIVQPLVGAALDRWGRQAILIVTGVCVAISGLLLVAFATQLWLVGAGVLTVQLGVNAALASWQPVLARDVRAEQRGVASGVRSALELAAGAAARISAGELLAAAAGLGQLTLLLLLTPPIGTVTLGAALTLCALPRFTGITRSPGFDRPFGTLRRAPSLRGAPPAFVWWFIARSTFWCGALSSSAFLLFVATDLLGFSEAEAQQFVSRLIVLLGATLSAVVLPAGWLADRIGRTPLMVAAGMLAGLGAAMVTWERSLVLPAAILIGAGSGMHLSSSLAMINDIVPRQEVARYLGIANIATTSGSMAARAGGGLLVSAVNALTQSPAGGYIALYAVAAALFMLSAGSAAVLHRHQRWDQRGVEDQ